MNRPIALAFGIILTGVTAAGVIAMVGYSLRPPVTTESPAVIAARSQCIATLVEKTLQISPYAPTSSSNSSLSQANYVTTVYEQAGKVCNKEVR